MHPVEARYSGTCTIYTMTKSTDINTNITSATETEQVKDQPCRMVVESFPATDTSQGVPAVSEIITLLISSSVTVAPGSRVAVTQEGRTEHFKSSGIPAVYPSHQEIELVRTERWA